MKFLIKKQNVFIMYQIVLKGYFESEDPDKLVDEIKRITDETKSDLIGDFVVYQLAPYVDYQKADVIDS